LLLLLLACGCSCCDLCAQACRLSCLLLVLLAGQGDTRLPQPHQRSTVHQLQRSSSGGQQNSQTMAGRSSVSMVSSSTTFCTVGGW
jgi:hypothetical protein